ncbi:hypothetical protein GLOIN_2v1771782 [Rhizophagus clarus]|uniref:Uncharacterized protein n=1 Tax=Rhizophagus clarus TaxID=94130 RepID=A0A8H3QCR6_9GLOM|nr:hypothetical protein GLOIN_2v1771782 [Rhizophagus clarus]
MKQSGKVDKSLYVLYFVLNVLAEIGSNTTSLEDINNEIRVENLGRIYINSINKENEVMLNIELEERKLALLERQVKLRKEVAEAETIELQNRS